MKMDHPLCRPQSTIPAMEQSERPSSSPRLAIFVYGTLMVGQKNHDYFCGNAIQIRPATTLGQLYALPAGYPALEVPEQHILARGTADPLVDAAVQSRFSDDPDHMPAQTRPSEDWDLVHGELITFTDPLRNLPPIDRLEGFHPGWPSLYQRVLIPVFSCRSIQFCWTYIMPGCPKGRRLPDGLWQPDKP